MAGHHTTPPPPKPAIIRCVVTAYCTTPRRTSWPAASRGGTAAVDPRVIPYGSTLVINGRRYIAMGRHGRNGRVIDLWMPTRHECMRWGRRVMDVTVIPPAPRARTSVGGLSSFPPPSGARGDRLTTERPKGGEARAAAGPQRSQTVNNAKRGARSLGAVARTVRRVTEIVRQVLEVCTHRDTQPRRKTTKEGV
jgi:3D (Asp-Asp-Asp) domain-containing protein